MNLTGWVVKCYQNSNAETTKIESNGTTQLGSGTIHKHFLHIRRQGFDDDGSCESVPMHHSHLQVGVFHHKEQTSTIKSLILLNRNQTKN